jgi:beta-phosphoglucomutase family hydrolase
MRSDQASPRISRDRFDAVLFDLDGVLTDTAAVHAACWKRMFDAFLRERAEPGGASFRPFDTDADYRQYVDGKLRYDGVRSFLESRGIHLPHGDPGDPPSRATIAGLGNLKDQMVKEVLASGSVDVFEGSLVFLRHVRRAGLKTAVVSASRNAQAVLRSVGIEEFFDVRVDGEVAERLRLPGKPMPDTFLEAARELGSDALRTIVVEDALAGVQAGRAGGFGLVVGIDRRGDSEAMRAQGADVVVRDLRELIE